MADEIIDVVLNLDDNMSVTLKGTSTQIRKFEADIKRLNSNIDKSTERVRHNRNALRDWSIIIGQSRNVIHQLWFVTGQWMSSIIKTNAEIERLTYLMRGLSRETGMEDRMRDARDSVDALFEMARTSPFEIGTLTDSFVKLKSVGIDPLEGSMQALVDANAAMGGDNDKFHRASIAIQQMAGKGVISMEELRQQLGEAVPRAIELMARSMNTTYGKLVEQISKGTVAARPALEQLFLEFDRVYGGKALEMMETYSGQFSRLITNMKQLVSQNSGIGDFFETIKEQLISLNDFLESPAAQNYATMFGNAMASAAQFIGGFISKMYELRDAIVLSGKAMALYWIGQKGAAIASSIISLSRLLTGQIALWRALSASQMQASVAALRASDSFKTAAGSMSAYNAASTSAIAMAGRLARGMIGMVGPIGVAAVAIWSIIDVLDVFGSKHREVLQDISEGQRIASEAQREQAQEAISALKSELEQEKSNMDTLLEYQRAATQKLVEKRNKLKAAEEAGNREGYLRTLRQDVETAEKGFTEIANKVNTVQQNVANLNAEIEENESTVSKAIKRWDDWVVSDKSEDALDGIRDQISQISAEYDAASIKIQENEELSDEARGEALNEAREAYYESAKLAWQGFIEEQNEALRAALASGDEQAAAIIQSSLSKARAALASVFASLNATAPTVTTVDTTTSGGGGGRSPMERLQEMIKEASVEADELGRRLADPFAYELPKAIDRARKKIDRLAEQMSGGKWTQQMKDLFDQIASNAATEELLDMADATRDIERALMGSRAARREGFDEEVSRIKQMKARLTEMGLWRIEWEKIVQAQLQALQDQYMSESPLGEYLTEWKDVADNIEEVGVDAMQSISQSMADMVTEGKADFADLARSAVNSLLQVSFNAALSGLGSLAQQGLQSAFPALAAPAPAPVSHSGSIVGSGPGRSRGINMDAFSTAPRFHTGGIIGQERNAILEKGEGVFTAEQMKAIGAGMSATKAAKINIINQSGQDVDSEQANVRMDPEGMIVDVVLKKANKPGPFRDSLRRALK